jgi:hypothetical protein
MQSNLKRYKGNKKEFALATPAHKKWPPLQQKTAKRTG